MTGILPVMIVLSVGLSLVPCRVRLASAQSAQVGQAQNAIGTLVVVRPDGVEHRLRGKGVLQLFEGDVLRTEASSQALIEFRDGIQVALNENTTFKIFSRWDKAKGITPIIRLKQGEIWVKTGERPKPLEVETPVAVAAVREAEFNIKISGDGQSILTGIQGIVELATAFGTCSVPPSTVSYGVRGQRCTRPAPADVTPVIGWTQTLLGGPPVAPTLGPALAEKIKQRGGEVGPAPSSPPLPEAELSIRPLEARAGSNLTLVVKITNKGKGPLYRFQGKTRSADPALDGQLFYLGKIDAGQSAEDALVVQIPRDQRDVEVPMRIEFEEHNGFVPYPLEAMIALKGLPRPRFAYTYQIIDDGSGTSVGNGDGRIQRGEAVDLLLTLKNVGTVPARETRAEIKREAWAEITSPVGQGLVILHGRVDLGMLKPDETKTARVNLFIGKDLAAPEIPLRLLIREGTSLDVMLDEALKLAVDSRPPSQIVATNKLVAVKETSAKIHSGAGPETSVIASAGKDQPLAVTGQLGDWYRVQISETEVGWLAKGEVAEAPVPAQGYSPVPMVRGPAVVKLFQKAPPVIALASPSEGQQIVADRVQLIGAAASEKGIAQVEVRINGRLLGRREGGGITVKGTGEGAFSERQTTANLEFSERVPLQEGKNEIAVTAFDQENLFSTRTVTITRVVDRGKIWAVVIGISSYKAVRPLKFADKDAQALYDYLLSDVGVPKEQLTLLTNERATLFNLKRSLGTDLRRNAGQMDTVIIYYAGHGAPESDANSLDEDGLEKYLVPYDADPNDLYTTGLPMREVETILQRLAAERVIFITDSCYSGATAGRTFATAAHRAITSDAFLTRLAKAKGRVVLTASRASEISEERDALAHGVFTYYLLQGLGGKADLDGDGIITVDEIYTYVAQKVPEATGQNQHPVKKGEVEGQLILGRVR